MILYFIPKLKHVIFKLPLSSSKCIPKSDIDILMMILINENIIAMHAKNSIYRELIALTVMVVRHLDDNTTRCDIGIDVV